MNRISAQILADKLQDPEFAKQVSDRPRRREMIWFLQWRSWQPGGLETFAQEFLAEYGDRVGTRTMREFGNQWTTNQCLEIWNRTVSRNAVRTVKSDWAGAEFSRWHEANFEAIEDGKSAAIQEGLTRFNRSYFLQQCLRVAKTRLPQHLHSLCVPRSWNFHLPEFAELEDALLNWMDAHAEKAATALGRNQVTEMVFKRLHFSLSQKYPVSILGESRVGKTKSVTTWCAQRPGQARLVTLPETNRDWELFAAHAEALGIPYDDRTSARTLKRAVEFVLQHAGLFIVYDEAHHLLPQKYDRNTTPKRLNWVRCQVIDRGIGCAFFATRQTYNTSMEKFVQTTRFNFEQWLGRIAAPLILPAELCPTEMLAAAKALFPEIKEALLNIIVARCIQKESGFRFLQSIASYARFLAQEAGRREVTLEDVDGALDEMLKDAADLALADPKRTLRSPAAAPARQIRDAIAPRLATDTLPGRSVNPICPEPGGTEIETASV
jgi:hypothetical protein